MTRIVWNDFRPGDMVTLNVSSKMPPDRTVGVVVEYHKERPSCWVLWSTGPWFNLEFRNNLVKLQGTRKRVTKKS